MFQLIADLICVGLKFNAFNSYKLTSQYYVFRTQWKNQRLKFSQDSNVDGRRTSYRGGGSIVYSLGMRRGERDAIYGDETCGDQDGLSIG